MTKGDTVDLTDILPAGPNGGPAPAFEVLTFGVSGGSNADMARGAVTCSGVTIGAAMPASTECSRAYDASGAPDAPTGGLRGLDVGETITITYEQIIASTAPCATITNTASVQDRASTSGTTDLVGVVATQSDGASLEIDCYDLAIAKVASPAQVAPGGTITWTVTVTNNGPGDMEGPAANDVNPLVVTDVFPTGDVGAASLVSATGPAGACNLAGSTVTCASGLPDGGQEVLTFSQVVSGTAADGTVIANTASVTDPTTGDANDSSTDQTVVGTFSLTLAKTADTATYSAVGDVISYEYLITNSGSVALSGPFVVDDDRASDESCPTTQSLAPTESITCTASYTITQADIDVGSVTNNATASGDRVTSNVDSVTVNAAQGPGVSLVKSSTTALFDTVGDDLEYQYVVTNTGNTSLAGPVVVTDDKTTVTCPDVATVGDLDGDLDPGESVTCTATYTVTQADVDAGGVTNVATASVDGIVSAVDSATVSTAAATPPPPTVPPTDTHPGVGSDVPAASPWIALVVGDAGGPGPAGRVTRPAPTVDATRRRGGGRRRDRQIVGSIGGPVARMQRPSALGSVEGPRLGTRHHSGEGPALRGEGIGRSGPRDSRPRQGVSFQSIYVARLDRRHGRNRREAPCAWAAERLIVVRRNSPSRLDRGVRSARFVDELRRATTHG